MNVKHFFSKNVVVIVLVPAIIGAHYGWAKLQGIDYLVSPEDRKKLPFASLFKKD